jgi:hypothetical protein
MSYLDSGRQNQFNDEATSPHTLLQYKTQELARWREKAPTVPPLSV